MEPVSQPTPKPAQEPAPAAVAPTPERRRATSIDDLLEQVVD